MDNTCHINTVIRQRGQLTIPGELREKFSWLNPDSVITISIGVSDELLIKPYSSHKTGQVNWKKMWANIKLARSLKGKRGNLSEFIIRDRKNH